MRKSIIIGIIAIIIIIILAAFLLMKPAGEEPETQTQEPETDSPVTGDATEPVPELDATATQAMQKCTMECARAKVQGIDLSSGPCLSEQIIIDWVCDIAHDPRTAVDDDTANQCANYDSLASHFVEVDPDCNFIRAI